MCEILERLFLIAKAEALGMCSADLDLDSVLDLDEKWLVGNKVKCVILDADNTLFAHHAKTADAKMIAKLKQLAKKFTLGIASNTPNPKRIAELEAYFKSIGLKIIVSKGIGKKPMPGQFDYLAKAFKAKPGQCVMVGDNLFTDIAGAKLYGMKAVKVKPYDAKSEPMHFRFMRFWEHVLS